ncbi:MAG: hypothetical protein ACM3WQ_03835 [Chloroflexota bacterium]
MKNLIRNSKAVGKVTFSFTSLIVALTVALIVSGFILSNRIDSLQTTNSQLQNNYGALQSQYDELNNAYQSLKSTNPTAQNSQIASLQSQLKDANDLIANLQGQTGILPTYMDLKFSGSGSYGYYALQLSLKNTGAVPITQIYVTLNSIQTNMTLTYLNTTVGVNAPLPPYQTASGRQDTLVSHVDTYPLVIQATAINGTIYTYQTTITAHI